MYRIFVLWHRLEDCHPEGGARESRLMSLKNKGAWAASITELTSLSQGDYDVVINDYEKAKSLFGNTEVPVFKKGNFLFFNK